MTYFGASHLQRWPHSVCRVCFSLSKFTSYLSLCILLNSFSDKISKTWTSLSTETRSFQSLSRFKLFLTPWTTPCQGSLLKLMSIELVLASNHLIFCHPLSILPSIFPSIRVFSNESAVILETKKIKSVTVSIVSPTISHEAMGQNVVILVFWMLGFKSALHSPPLPSSRGSLGLHFLP